VHSRSTREARTYDCPRLGKPVVVSYMYRPKEQGESEPSGIHCTGARECGVDEGDLEPGHVFDWTLCPLYPDLVREGFLPR